MCFKASTVMQSMGIITSRTILPSSDVQGGSRERTYCPSTYSYGYGYDIPSKYSDTVSQYHALPMLARECVLSVIIQMSNKNAKHAWCAKADAKSTVVSGMMISLAPYYQPKAERIVRLVETADFNTVEHVLEIFNSTLSQKLHEAVPPINHAGRICYPKSGEYMQYKICPETDAEEPVYAFNQSKSMIEVIGLQEDPLWKQCVEVFKTWYKSLWGSDAWKWENTTQETQREWITGSSKRAHSACARKSCEKNEITIQERVTNPEQMALAWQDLGDPNNDPKFLFQRLMRASAPSTRTSTITQQMKQQDI